MTRFWPATSRISDSISRSDRAGQSSVASWRIDTGTVCSISWSRLPTPTAFSISSISEGEGPMWRRLAKSSGL